MLATKTHLLTRKIGTSSNLYRKSFTWNSSSRHFTQSKTILQQAQATTDIREPKAREKRKEAKIGAVRTDGRTKRWYKNVAVEPFTQAGENGYIITLDNRVIKTPKENYLFVPSLSLATAIAAEWDSHHENIRPISMPLMTLATTAIDVIPEKRKMIIDSLMNHLNTDVVCMRFPSGEISRRQAKAHDPLIKWMSEHYQIPPLTLNQGFGFGKHHEQTITSVQWNLFNVDDWTLAALDTLTTYTRSLVITFALWNKNINVEEAITAARVEEDYNIQKCGEVKGSHDLDIVDQQIKISAASFFLHMLPEKAKK